MLVLMAGMEMSENGGKMAQLQVFLQVKTDFLQPPILTMPVISVTLKESFMPEHVPLR